VKKIILTIVIISLMVISACGFPTGNVIINTKEENPEEILKDIL